MKTRRSSHTRAEVAVLPELILSCLRREPMWTVQELMTELGFSDACVRTRLRVLQERGQAHYSESRTHNGIGLSQFWNLGPAPKNLKLMSRSKTIRAAEKRTISAQQEEADEIDYCPPLQFTSRDYPRHDYRDPLVAALFGPAHREAA